MEQEQAKVKRGRKAAENAAPSSVQVLDRSLKLLALIAENDGSTLTDLADASGMAPSTVHRLLSSLANHGMVSHDLESGDWTIGVKAFEIGNAFRRFRKLGILARPYLKTLMETSGETANIGVEDSGDVVFISQIESHAPMRAFSGPDGADLFTHPASARPYCPPGRTRKSRMRYRGARSNILRSAHSTTCLRS